MKISELGFSVRVANCLDGEYIDTVDDLCKLSGHDLLCIKNFGPASLREVRSRLAAIGRSLLEDPVPTAKAAPPQQKLYGIIPCRRCAYFVPDPRPDDYPNGVCRRKAPAFSGRMLGERVHAGHGEIPSYGCGDGLLREEAAPLPPEQQEPKP